MLSCRVISSRSRNERAVLGDWENGEALSVEWRVLYRVVMGETRVRQVDVVA